MKQIRHSDFIEMLNSHRKLIYKVCHLYCADPEDRKDLFQEIVLQVWKSLGSFRNESALSTWIYRIALNTAITHFKKEKQSGDSLPLRGMEIPDLESGDGREELVRELYRAIEALDKVDKSVVLLYLEKKSYEEMSEITGLSKSNVGVRLNRIKSKLSNLLTQKDYGT